MADYQDYHIWAAHLNEALETTRDLLSRPDDWKPPLQGLWYHPNAEEVAAPDAPERVKQGYLERLTVNTSALRGSDKDRRSLYPSALRKGDSIENLSLYGVMATNCHLLLNLGYLELKLSFLSTNATVQLYWPDSWAAVENTPRYKYGTRPEQRMLIFSVALALDFGDFVISFNGPDNLLFTCDWSLRSTPDGTEIERPFVTDILDDWPGYMQCVVRWIEGTYTPMSDEGKDMCIAVFLSQNSGEQDLFAGIRYHCRSEVLHRAGLSPYLTLREVVEARSRLYRLILGAWQYKYLVLRRIWPEHVRPAVHDRLISPLFEQRFKFLRSTLLVVGKREIKVTKRFKDQIEASNEQVEIMVDGSSGRKIDLDVFEPSLVEDALRHAPEFCPAIFSETFWSSYKDEIIEQPWLANPLIVQDMEAGTFLSGRKLVCTDSWTELFIDVKYRRSCATNRMYVSCELGEVWTPVLLGGDSIIRLSTMRSSYGELISTEDVYTAGVLESPGNAIAIRTSSAQGVFYTYPSRGAAKEDDLATYNIMRLNIVQSISRIKEYWSKLGSKKKGTMSDDERAQRQRAYEAFDEMWHDRFGHLPVESTKAPKKRVRRRQVDMFLADIRDEDEPGERKRARKEKGISMTIDKERDWWDYLYYGEKD
ncbi:hypothetical protein PENSPDRAFT_738126 [Peniophora sp. CONT]|nr:hypothetical protein PENSPDRAFT_738126 [Peniophora sp. CONT]